MKELKLEEYIGKELYVVGFNAEDPKLGNHFRLKDVVFIGSSVFMKVEEEKRTYIGERISFSIGMEGSEEEIMRAREEFKQKKKRLYDDEKNWQVNTFVYYLNIGHASKILLPNL